MSDYSVVGRVIAITGSTGGLGSALAKALRAKGARLTLLDLHGDAVQAQAKALGAKDIARGWPEDVTSCESTDTAMKTAAVHFGGIDINLNGVWRTFRAALNHVQQRRGHLLAISSMAAFVHSPLQAPYTASKAGVWALCDSVRLEVKHLGVTVGSVHPTFFNTPMMEMVHADPAGIKLWGGNRGAIWGMVTLDSVVNGIISGIESRCDMVVLPARQTLIAKAPGLFRRVIEEAIALASRQTEPLHQAVGNTLPSTAFPVG